MAVADVALSVRARGIATRLLTRDALEALTTAPDLATLARNLASAGALADRAAGPLDVFAVERAAARIAADHLRTLFRWRRRARGVLEVFAADADRRSLRALLRGAAQGSPAAIRLRGLLATPTLPQPLLDRLAAQSSGAAIARELVASRYPDAERLLGRAERTATGLLAIEAALLNGFARRATRAAAGDRILGEFVAGTVDTGNAVTAALLAGVPRDVDPVRLFVEGGRSLSRQAFTAVVEFRGRTGGGSAAGGDASRIEREFLEETLIRLRRIARRDPLSSAPLLRVVLLIDAQARDVRSLAWGATLAAPAATRARALVTPR